MPRVSDGYRFLDLGALRHLTQGLTFDIGASASVIEAALVDLNDQTKVPQLLQDWIKRGGRTVSPCPYDGKGRIIVEVRQTVNSSGQAAHFTTILRKKDEKETAPVVFFNMHSPTLDIPMRVEVPLRAMLRGNQPLEGTYTLYLHALLTSRGESLIYYGITKRGWNIRFNEHMRAAIAQKSKRLLASRLNDLIEARVNELYGQVEDRPVLAGLISAVCGAGLSREAALDSEQYLVDKYSLAGQHPNGLNMIPGGLAGLKVARQFFKRK